MCSDDGSRLCLAGIYMRQFPKYDKLHEAMTRLASTFPICVNCRTSSRPRHIICMESLQGRIKGYAEAGLAPLVREYLAEKDAFMSSEKNRIEFLASLN